MDEPLTGEDEVEDDGADEQPPEPDSLDESLWEESSATSDEDVERDTFSHERKRAMRRSYS